MLVYLMPSLDMLDQVVPGAASLGHVRTFYALLFQVSSRWVSLSQVMPR
jgi:hypothetical protein